MNRAWLAILVGCARDLSGDLDPGPTDGTATEEGVTVIDARSETEAVGFDLDTGAVVALADPAWDLSFLRFEIRLNSGASGDMTDLVALIGSDRLARLDLFDVAQLAAVVRVCRESRSLSAAGRALFAASRTTKSSTNDADRLRKYLARFELSWNEIAGER